VGRDQRKDSVKAQLIFSIDIPDGAAVQDGAGGKWPLVVAGDLQRQTLSNASVFLLKAGFRDLAADAEASVDVTAVNIVEMRAPV